MVGGVGADRTDDGVDGDAAASAVVTGAALAAAAFGADVAEGPLRNAA